MSKVHEVKPEKVAAVADIVEKLKNAQSVVICSYSGLTVEQVTEIRKQCRENDAAYCVLKNRLVLRALNEVGITGLDDLLNGPNAFVFSMKDAVSGPKIINDYIEKNKLESFLFLMREWSIIATVYSRTDRKPMMMYFSGENC